MDEHKKNNFTTTKKVVPIDSIAPNPWNPNKESKVVYESIKETIKQKGFIGTITTRQYLGCNQIINGEHRWRACKELGWKEVPVEDMGEISDTEAYFFTLKLNEGGKNEVEKLAKMYEQMEDGQLSLLGSTADEIKNTKDLFKFDFAQYQTNDPGIPENVFAHVLSFKFNDEEWRLVQESLKFVKKDNETEKQWFMQMMQHYLQVNIGSGPGETHVQF